MWLDRAVRNNPQVQELPLACPETVDVPAATSLLAHPRVKHEIFADLDDTKRLFYKEPVRLGWIKRGENETVRRNRILPADMLMIFPRGVTGFGRRRLVLHARGPELNGLPLYWRRTQVAVRFPDEVKAICGTSANPKLSNLSEVCQELGLAAGEETLRLERSAAALGTREGTVVIARLPYYHQRILLDADGSTIWLGMDESKDRTTLFMVYTAPSTTRGLVRYAYHHGYKPIVRWRTVPPTWPYYLPLCDYPMANVYWLDLYVRQEGQAQLFRPKPGTTVARWQTMLQMLEHLWLETLAQVGYQLVSLTKDRQRLDRFFEEKYRILHDYFEISEVNVRAA